MLLSLPAVAGAGRHGRRASALARAAEHVIDLQPDIRALAQVEEAAIRLPRQRSAGGPRRANRRSSCWNSPPVRSSPYFDSPLGFRHGPKSVLDGDTLVVVYVSTDPYTRRYDLDIVAEIRAHNSAGRRHGDQHRAHPGRARIAAVVLPGLDGLDDVAGAPCRIWCSRSTSRCSPH